MYNVNTKEHQLRDELIHIFSKSEHFDVISEPEGIYPNGKRLRPDFGFYFRDLFFVVEVKDDDTKHFEIKDLYRQAINYKHTVFNGKMPNFVFIVTTSLLKGDQQLLSNKEYPIKPLGFLLGIGQIHATRNGKIRVVSGSSTHALYNKKNEQWELLDFSNLPNLVIGTKTSSNKLNNKESLRVSQNLASKSKQIWNGLSRSNYSNDNSFVSLRVENFPLPECKECRKTMQKHENKSVEFFFCPHYCKDSIIFERIGCKHDNLRTTRHRIKCGTFQIRMQCIDCGELIGRPIAKSKIAEERDSLPLANDFMPSKEDKDAILKKNDSMCEKIRTRYNKKTLP